MNVCISEQPIRLELSAFKGIGTTVVHSNAHEAYGFLKSHADRPFAVAQMRTLLSSAGARNLDSDDEVWREAARRLVAGRLHLTMSEPVAAYGGELADNALPSPLSAPPKRSPVSAEKPVPPPRKRPPAEEAPAPEPEQTASLDQDVQAEALERAAAAGTPFCAMCEKARRLAAGEPA
jgi:predicted component of type VI protein secretion system